MGRTTRKLLRESALRAGLEPLDIAATYHPTRRLERNLAERGIAPRVILELTPRAAAKFRERIVAAKESLGDVGAQVAPAPECP